MDGFQVGIIILAAVCLFLTIWFMLPVVIWLLALIAGLLAV